MIIDDEPKIRRGIAGAVAAYKPDYPAPILCASAEDALRSGFLDKVDLLFLDIQLPGISGLSLLESIRQTNPSLSVIIISGYAEFSFAQKALSLQVVDYLLKPIDLSRLYTLLDQVETDRLQRNPATIRELKALREKLFREHLLLEDGISDNRFIGFLNEKGIKDSAFFLVNIKETGGTQGSILEKVKAFRRCLSQFDLLDTDTAETLQITDEHFAILFFIGNQKDLSALCEGIRLAADRIGVHFSCSSVYPGFSSIKKALMESEEQDLLLHDMTQYVSALISSRSSCHSAIERTIHYIMQHYREPITLSLIAEKVFLHQSYLSNLFKKETGCGLSSFITDYRLYIAKKLLTETKDKISSISEDVGFQEYSYFSQVFSRRVGMTPQKYRSFMQHSHYDSGSSR